MNTSVKEINTFKKYIEGMNIYLKDLFIDLLLWSGYFTNGCLIGETEN